MAKSEKRTKTTRLPAQVEHAIGAADDKKALDLVVLDLRKAAGFTDFFDFVVHIFAPETRLFYGLERLWGNAERIEIPASR